MSTLTVLLWQGDLHWHTPAANHAAIDAALATHKKAFDLLVLPEMFATGFSMDADAVCQSMDGASVDWLARTAARHDCAVGGSLAIRDGGAFNRFLWTTPAGIAARYDKRHLFRMAREHHHYSAGESRCVFEWQGWRLLTQVCYDLRFPVFSRLRGDYDAIVYVANWPERRRHHWRQLLIARAIENQCYVIGVNRVGSDGNGVDYSGDSLVVDPLGEIVFDAGSRRGLFAVNLELETVCRWREKFPAWMDADDFKLV